MPEDDPRPPPARVVVVGGANVDVVAHSGRRAVPGTSNPGIVSIGYGGVARNVAENLARLGTPTHLVAAVGRDPLGEELLAATAAAGVDVDHVVRTDGPTGTYTAVLDVDGELLVAVADMAATEALAPADVRRVAGLVAAADLLVLDANLAPDTVVAAVRAAAGSGTPVLLDPVSVPKAARLAPVLAGGHRWLTFTPNRDELAALTGLPVDTEAGLSAAVTRLHDLGVEQVWVRLGAEGSLLSAGGDRLLLPVQAAPVADVTGAGDAMLAAYCHALLGGRSPADAARFGHAAAALTVAVPHAVRPDLSAGLVEQALSSRSPR